MIDGFLALSFVETVVRCVRFLDSFLLAPSSLLRDP